MKSGRPATGKNPLEDSFDDKFTPADVALAVQRNPDLKAVGVFTGIRGNGIVILDVDRNLKRLLHSTARRSTTPRASRPLSPMLRNTCSAFQKISGLKLKAVVLAMQITKSFGTTIAKASSTALTPAVRSPFQGTTNLKVT